MSWLLGVGCTWTKHDCHSIYTNTSKTIKCTMIPSVLVLLVVHCPATVQHRIATTRGATHKFTALSALVHLFYSQPLNVILWLFPDELHSLQDVGDVIDPSLLDLQDLGGPVQVKNAIRGLGNQAHELLGQQAQGGVVARPLAWRLGSCGVRGQKMKLRATFQTYGEPHIHHYRSLPLTPWTC